MTNRKIYISHQFKYCEEYELLIKKFKELNWEYCTYLIPEHDSFDYNRKKAIEIELMNHIQTCNIFLILARTTIGDSFWLIKEIEFNNSNNNIIIGIIPNDYEKRTPIHIEKAVNHGYVNFNIDKIYNLLKNII